MNTSYKSISKNITKFDSNSKNTTNFRIATKVNTSFESIDKNNTDFSNGSIYKLGIKLDDSIITLDSLSIYLQGFTTAIAPNLMPIKTITSYEEI
jgi:hypothetical protein